MRPACCGLPPGRRRLTRPRAACSPRAAAPECSRAAALTLEDAYGYAKFARVALGTNDIDMRARPHSAEELQFLADHVVGRVSLTYDQLQQAPAVLLAGFEPEDECPIVFLRLRKATRAGRMAVYALAAVPTRGLEKLSGTLLPTVPGAEAAALTALAGGSGGAGTDSPARRCSASARRRDPRRRASG